jgi:hypothetical protein
LLQAVGNLLADVRGIWQEGKHETATRLAKRIERSIPEYLSSVRKRV